MRVKANADNHSLLDIFTFRREEGRKVRGTEEIGKEQKVASQMIHLRIPIASMFIIMQTFINNFHFTISNRTPNPALNNCLPLVELGVISYPQ